jgi:hypothetical protein
MGDGVHTLVDGVDRAVRGIPTKYEVRGMWKKIGVGSICDDDSGSPGDVLGGVALTKGVEGVCHWLRLGGTLRR